MQLLSVRRLLLVPDATPGLPESLEVKLSTTLRTAITGEKRAIALLASVAQSAAEIAKVQNERLTISKPAEADAAKLWKAGELKAELRPTEMDRAAFERICSTPAGQAAIEAATQAAIDIITIAPEKTSPGHDLRHIVKDVLVGAKAAFCDATLVDKPAQAFVVGVASLLHDAGRLVEKTIDGTVAGGIKGDRHAEYSTLLMREVIEAFMLKAKALNMPESERALCAKIWDEALLAVINHQSGAGKESWICQAVSSADRAQLVGPEALLRYFQHDVFVEGAALYPNGDPRKETNVFLPGAGKDSGNYDLLTHALFYGTYLFPAIPGVVTQVTEAGKDFTALALLSATLPDLSDPRKLVDSLSFDELRSKYPDFTQIFAPNIAKIKGVKLDNPKHPQQLTNVGFSEERFMRVCEMAQQLPPAAAYGGQGVDKITAINALYQLLTTTPMVSTNFGGAEALYGKVIEKVQVLSVDQANRLTRTIALVAQGLKDSDEASRMLATESAKREDPLSVMFSKLLQAVSKK